MSDDPNTFNPYQPSEDPFAERPADPRFVSGYIQELVRWQTTVAVMVSLGGILCLILILLAAIGSEEAAAYLIGTMICPLLLVVVVFVVPAVELWKSITAARRYADSESSEDLSEFASSQRVLWRTLAIVTAILGVFFILVVAGAVFGSAEFTGVGN
jgi:uncharacterized membrane protein